MSSLFWMEHHSLGRECVCIAYILFYGNPLSRRIILVQPEYFHPFFLLLSLHHSSPSESFIPLLNCTSIIREIKEEFTPTSQYSSLVLPSGPHLSTSFFPCLWPPISLEMMMNCLEPVLDGPEQSKDILWKQNPSQDAQDAIRPLQILAEMPNAINSGRPLPRITITSPEEIMREEHMVPQQLMEDWHCNSDSPEVAQTPSDPSRGDEGSPVPLPSADRTMHTASLIPQERVANISSTNTSNNDHPDSKLAAQNRTSEPDLNHIVPCSISIESQKNHLERMSPMDSESYPRASSQASCDLTSNEKQDRVPTKPIAGAVNPEEGLVVHTAGSGCLCDCGGDAMRCIRPNRPPSPVPYTPFEKSFALETGYIIKLRLEAVIRNLEPSRRIWWREEFGGCAPDRKPLNSEIRSMRDNDLGSVLRTSLPLFNDVTTIRNKAQHKPSRKRQRSMSLPTTAAHGQDGVDKPPQNCTCPLNYALRSAPLYESSKKCKISTIEFGTSLTHDVRGRHLFREPIVAPKAKPLKSPTFYIPDKLPPLKYNAVGRLPPVRYSELLQKPPPRPKIQEPTAAERKKRRQSTLQNIEAAGRKVRQMLAMNVKRISLPLEDQPSASKFDTVHQPQSDTEVKEKARNTERPQQVNQHLSQDIEVMKARENSHHGTALYRHDRWVPDDLFTPHINDIGETQWKSMDPRMRLEAHQGQKSLYQPLDMVKLRRNAVTL